MGGAVALVGLAVVEAALGAKEQGGQAEQAAADHQHGSEGETGRGFSHGRCWWAISTIVTPLARVGWKVLASATLVIQAPESSCRLVGSSAGARFAKGQLRLSGMC